MKKIKNGEKEIEDKVNAWQRNWKMRHPEYPQEWRDKNREKLRKYHREYAHRIREELKEEIFKKLGNKCVNPFNFHKEEITDRRCLQIDHINGGGNKQRLICRNNNYFRYVLTHLDEFQLLCANCNWIKRFEDAKSKSNIPSHI